MRQLLFAGFCAATFVLLPASSQAHFRLLAPASWIEENALGDPQKAGPCGGTNADYGKRQKVSPSKKPSGLWCVNPPGHHS